jgi:hypothetical protein
MLRTSARRTGDCRSGLWAVIPTKPFGSANQLLAAMRSFRQRIGLAEAMLQGALVAAVELAESNEAVA